MFSHWETYVKADSGMWMECFFFLLHWCLLGMRLTAVRWCMLGNISFYKMCEMHWNWNVGHRGGGNVYDLFFSLLQSQDPFELKTQKHTPGKQRSNCLRECWWMVGGKTAYQFPKLLAHPNTLSLWLSQCQKFLISSPPPRMARHTLHPCQAGLSKFKVDYCYSAPMTLFTAKKNALLRQSQGSSWRVFFWVVLLQYAKALHVSGELTGNCDVLGGLQFLLRQGAFVFTRGISGNGGHNVIAWFFHRFTLVEREETGGWAARRGWHLSIGYNVRKSERKREDGNHVGSLTEIFSPCQNIKAFETAVSQNIWHVTISNKCLNYIPSPSAFH